MCWLSEAYIGKSSMKLCHNCSSLIERSDSRVMEEESDCQVAFQLTLVIQQAAAEDQVLCQVNMAQVLINLLIFNHRTFHHRFIIHQHIKARLNSSSR